MQRGIFKSDIDIFDAHTFHQISLSSLHPHLHEHLIQSLPGKREEAVQLTCQIKVFSKQIVKQFLSSCLNHLFLLILKAFRMLKNALES